MNIDIPILLCCLAIIFIPSGYFCARERVRQFPDEGFWEWRDWVPFLGMIRLHLYGEMSPAYVIGLLILGAGQILPPVMETDLIGSAAIYGGSFLAFEVCGIIFLIPYLREVMRLKNWQGMTAKIGDWLFLALVSPLGLLYYAVFIHSRPDYPKKKKGNTQDETKPEENIEEAEEETEEEQDDQDSTEEIPDTDDTSDEDVEEGETDDNEDGASDSDEEGEETYKGVPLC